MKSEPVLLLTLPRQLGFGQGVIRGVYRYLEENDLPWLVDYPSWSELQSGDFPQILKNRLLCNSPEVAGLIGHFSTQAIWKSLQTLPFPVVNVSRKLKNNFYPEVVSDDFVIGRLAADYFLRKGFVHFAFSGIKSYAYSRLRLEGFQARLAEEGFSVTVNQEEDYNVGNDEPFPYYLSIKSLCQKISESPKPVALFCKNDFRAMRILQVGHQFGLKVPTDLAILGVDAEDLNKSITGQSLSSIIPGTEAMGYHAAQLIKRSIGQGRQPYEQLLIPPVKVLTGQSTNLTLQRDPHVRKALQYIQENYKTAIRSDEVAGHCGICRRQLERLFKTHLSSSPHLEIQRLRVQHASHLLLSTAMRIEDIAEACGFATPREFYHTFRRLKKQAPNVYRKTYPSAAPASGSIPEGSSGAYSTPGERIG